MTKILLISISFLFGTCLKTVPTINIDSPLVADSTIIVIPNLSEHSSDACRFLLASLKKGYKINNGNSNNLFPILREYTELGTSIYPDTTGKTFIAVGRTFFDSSDIKLPPASFIIKKKGRVIIIRGSDDAGDYAGVSYFLDHYCGVRFYMPGTLFTKYPTDSTVSLPDTINIVDSSFTKNITSTGFWGTGNISDPHNILYWDNYWALLNGLNHSSWGSFQHTMSGLFYDSLIMKMYPDVYPHGYFPTSPDDQNFEPDFSAPDLVDASFDIAVNYFTHNPTLNTIAFSVMDGSGGYMATGQSLIDANAKWLNSLSERMPNKTIAYLVYSALNGIPTIKLNKNVLPITVWHLSNGIADSFYLPQGGLSNWAKVTSNIGNDDWAEGKGFIYPRLYSHIISSYLQEIKKQNISFGYAHIEAYPNWALDGIKYYEMGKMYWNPDVNLDSIRSQFCTDMFGNADKQMKSYFDNIESISTWLNNHSVTPTHLYNYPQQLFLDSTRMVLVSNCRSYLNAAANLATTQDEKDRVQFFNIGFTLIEGFWNKYNLKDSIDLKGYIKNNVSGTDRILFSGTDSNYVNSLYNLINSIK